MKLLFTPLLAALPFSISSAAVLGTSGTGIFLLTTDNGLVSMTDSAPALASPPVPITGVVAGDTLVAIDVRPVNQQLYALGINSSANTFRLYHLTPENGVATPMSTPQSMVDFGGSPIPAAAVRYDIDFNPVAERLRVVCANGLNFRMNPSTGECVDTNSVAADGVNPDAPINGGTTTLEGAAYTNNEALSSVTTLYTLDPSSDSLFISNPPNNGTQTQALAVTLNGSVLNFSAVRGFDIAPGVNAVSMNGAATGSAYAVLTSGITSLYRINLSTGAATLLGTPAGFSITSLAVRPQSPVAVGLDASGSGLVLFRPDIPGTTLAQLVTGLTAGEVLVGIDFRPATGQLMGLGVNSGTGKGTLYNIEPRSGAARVVGVTSGMIQFTTDGVTPLDLPSAATGYGLDFNPTVDRIRVVTGSGMNFRINPDNGTPVDGNNGLGSAVSGTNPDAAINSGTTVVSAAAYTNSYSNLLGTTTLYTLDHSSNSLFIQSPANSGTQILPKTVTVNGTILDFTAANGFDITEEGGTNVSSNAASPGYGWASLTVGGTARLYRINLRTGAATLKGQIGSGAVISGLSVSAEIGAGFAPLSWASSIGTFYRIETSEDLVNWQPYPVVIQAVQGTTMVPVPFYQGEARRFWRAVNP